MALVGREAGFKSVKDLKGRTIGVGSYGSTPDIVARMIVNILALTRHGGQSARPPRFRRLPDLAALKEGVVDVIIAAPPVDFEGQKMGFNILSRAGDVFPISYNGLGTSVRKINENPDEVKRVLRALIKANG